MGRKARLIGIASLTAFLTCASLGATGAERAGKEPKRWRAYPLNQVPENLRAQVQRDACDFESRQANGTRRAVLIFSFGRANFENGNYGAGSDSNFRSNKRIGNAIVDAARAYDGCRGSSNKRVVIAYGVTNFELTQEIRSPKRAKAFGRAQHQTVAQIKSRLPKGVSAALASDVEPGWDRRGSGRAINLVRSGAAARGSYFAFGTVGRCKPFGKRCQGNWSPLDIGKISQDNGIVSLPEIYYPKQAQAWARVAKVWDNAGNNCRGPKSRRCYEFGGVTAYPKGCAGVQYTPKESLKRMRKATRHEVGRAVVYFNPRRVGCRTGSPAAERSSGNTDVTFTGFKPVPGELVADPDPIVSSDVMPEIVNAYRVGTKREYTVVYGGTGPSGEGLVVVSRQVYGASGSVSQTIDTVDVPGTDAIRVTGLEPSGRVRFERLAR